MPLLPGPGAGASRDKWDLAPSVRLPNVSRGCGRSVSEPDCDVHGDDVDVALRGVVGVCPSFDVDVVRLRASRRWSPFSAFTLTLSGRENVIVLESRLLLALASDEDDLLDSVREIGSGGGVGATVWWVTAVVGAALGVVMVRPGLALVLPRTVAVEAVDTFRRLAELSTVEEGGCCSARDSDGRAGSGAGMASAESLRVVGSGWRERDAGVGEGS